MKAYCIKVFDPKKPNDGNPFVQMDEKDDYGDYVQISLNRGLSEECLAKMMEACPDCTYTLMEFDV